MRRRSETLSVRPGCARGDAESVLARGQPFVPVLDDGDECVGVLWEEDVRRWDEFAEASLLDPYQTRGSRCWPVDVMHGFGDAAAAL